MRRATQLFLWPRLTRPCAEALCLPRRSCEGGSPCHSRDRSSASTERGGYKARCRAVTRLARRVSLVSDRRLTRMFSDQECRFSVVQQASNVCGTEQRR
jgi:hypothetical protein